MPVTATTVVPAIGFLISAALIWLVPIGSGVQRPEACSRVTDIR